LIANLNYLFLGDTALHVAAREGFEDILKILVEYNPSVKVLNRNNQSPLNVSKEAVHPILLKLKEVNQYNLDNPLFIYGINLVFGG